MAVVRCDTDNGTASGRRRAARPTMEAAGNFVLVFVFGIAIATHSWFAPLVIGASVVTLFWFRNRVPDAYYGPSLTCAMLMRRRIAFREAAALWLIQSGTGLAAAALVGAIVDTRHLTIAASTVSGGALVAAFALDLVFTFVLCFASCDASRRDGPTTDDSHSGPIVFGVMASALAMGAIAIGRLDFNVAFDDEMLGILSLPTLWIYVVSQLFSGIAAVTTYASLAGQP
jgi:aquaporin Z